MNLDEKKLDDLAKEFSPVFESEKHCEYTLPANFISKQNQDSYKSGYRQAFADQQKKIEKLEKAVELMRSQMNEILIDCNVPVFSDDRLSFGNYQIYKHTLKQAHVALARVDSILKGSE